MKRLSAETSLFSFMLCFVNCYLLLADIEIPHRIVLVYLRGVNSVGGCDDIGFGELDDIDLGGYVVFHFHFLL